MTRLLHLLVLACLLLGLAPLAAVRAQESQPPPAAIESAAPQEPAGLSVARNEAVADFPTGITFNLDAETTAPIAKLELLYHAPGLETYSVELPSFEVGTTRLSLAHPVDLRAGQLPPGIDVQYKWRITEQNGDVVETPEQTTHWFDTRYTWQPLVGEHVTVYSYSGDHAFEQEILDAAERTIGSLASAYGATPDQPIRIWAYADKEDLYGALAPNSEPWIAGAAYPGLHIIMAIVPPGNLNELKRVIPHEISHQVLYQATENPFNSPPQWLDEGLATYWQETGRDRFYSYALQFASQGTIPPLRTLNGDFPYDHEAAMAAYAYSLSAVIYILDTWGDEGMSKLIAAFPEGVTYDEAVLKGLGITFEELDQRWRDDLRAKAQQAIASGTTTRFGDSAPGDASPWGSLGEALAISSGTIIMGLALLIAIGAGIVSLLRSRRRHDDEDDDLEVARLQWREWPEGLDPPNWQARSL